MEDDFTAQAQRFVRFAVFCAVTLGLAFGEWCLWGVGCGCAIIPKVWCGANFVEAHMI